MNGKVRFFGLRRMTVVGSVLLLILTSKYYIMLLGSGSGRQRDVQMDL